MTQFIKSIQQAVVTAVGTPYTLPAAVDLTKSMIIYNGATTSNGTATNFWNQVGRWSFDDNQHVRFTKDTAAAVSFSARATVVEFNSDVISNQSGVITINAGSPTGTAVITPVGATAFVIWEGIQTTAGAGGFSDAYGVALELTTSALVTAKVGYTLAADIKVAWRVIELSTNIISKIETFGPGNSSATGLTSFSWGLSGSFDGNRSLLFFNGMTFASAVASAGPTAYRLEFIPASTPNFTRNSTNSVSKSIYGTMVEFQAAALSGNVQRNTLPGDAATALPTASITSADPTMSWVQWCAESMGGNSNNGMMTIQQSGATTLQGQVQSSPSSASAVLAWQLITFDNTPVVGGGAAVGEGLTNSVLLGGGAGGRKLAA